MIGGPGAARHDGRRRAALAVLLVTASAITLAAAPSFASARAHPAQVALAGPRAVGSPRSLRPAITNPPGNDAPSAAFFDTCWSGPSTACDTAALVDFDAARAAEGLGPMTLPTGFDSMSAAEQLFVLADIERVDRGLVPVEGLSAPINALAQTGAATDSDPAFPTPFPGDEGGSNWAGAGSSTLLPEFLWVYDDGVGSGNEDCTSAGDPGCWGHRMNILAGYDSPVLMGAAETSDDTYGGSAAEEFISHDTKNSVLSPTWSSLQAQFAVGLSRSTIALSTGAAQTVPVTVWASGVAMDVTAAVTAGAGAWSVSPSSCPLSAGAECTLAVAWNPLDGSSATGTLTVTGPNGARTISLSAPLQPGQRAHLAVAAGRPTVRGTSSTVVTGVLTDAATSAPLAGREVTIESRVAGATGWVRGSTSDSTSAGSVRVRVTPRVNTAYRFVAAAGGGYPVATSHPVWVDVRPILAFSAKRSHLAHGSTDSLAVSSTPAVARARVTLERRVHGHWHVIDRSRLGPSGRHTFTVRFPRAGTKRLRVIEPATRRLLAASTGALVVVVR